MSFTRIDDTDIYIMLHLNLDDLRNYCYMNQQASKLCKTNVELKMKINRVKDKVDSIINIVDQKKYSILTNQEFGVFKPLIKDLHPSDEYSEMLLDSLNIHDTTFHIDIVKIVNYHIMFFVGYLEDEYYRNEEIIEVECNLDQLREFLLHIYYDKLV